MTASHNQWLDKKLRDELGIPAHLEKTYTTRQLLFVSNNRHLPRAELTRQYNQTFGTNIPRTQLQSLCKRHGWQTGNDGRFQRGQETWNKGKKGLQLSNGKGCFKTGNTPHTSRPVGSTRTREGYQWTKVAEPNQWRTTHRLIWEQAHGKIPKSHTLKFLDGDKANITLSNLALVSRAELAQLNRNHYDTAPNDLKPTVMLISKLETKHHQHARNGGTT
ncbi:HNH endonuclease signature motif containing protein [Thiothrix winogradskyi]|uniref:HNH endonuclease n=1 Tax=Thiothrix winogradskyi TaxID=96472 RepID=A0ABY3T305_9GAMM|nr:HNH endonuclease signature motif containing protein [Thiothrix winogradskyi]UJS26233.1 HNH endonuclease [Thiothrix winogradskyi]